MQQSYTEQITQIERVRSSLIMEKSNFTRLH